MIKRIGLGLVVTLVLLLIMIIALPLLAQTALEHFAPREVKQLPNTSMAYETIPDKPQLMDVQELEKLTGFTLLMPTYLPLDCRVRERFFDAKPRVAYLIYSCVGIAEQKAKSIQRPFIGEGSTQELTIGGNPAIYIGGAWVQLPGQKQPTWMPGVAQQLVFERNGILVRLDATARLSKEDLVRIAESIQ